MQVTELIGHPELLNRDTLYELRRIVGQCPYYHAARLLLVENLFLLHDPDFDEQLKQAAAFVPDARVLFDLVESINYEQPKATTPAVAEEESSGNRTLDLISRFLQQAEPIAPAGSSRRRVIDPVGDYMSMLEDLEDVEPAGNTSDEAPAHDVLGDYLSKTQGDHHIKLADTPAPEISEREEASDDAHETLREEYFTETLAKVFVKQGNYERAIEILTKINLENPRKSAYFADQIRFLQKLQKIKGRKMS